MQRSHYPIFSLSLLVTTFASLDAHAAETAPVFGAREGTRWISSSSLGHEADTFRNFRRPEGGQVFSGNIDDDDAKERIVVARVNGSLEWTVNDTDHDRVVSHQIFGSSSDTPVPADYDGDGQIDFAVVRKVGSSLQWRIDYGNDGKDIFVRNYGMSTDTPVPADYDGKDGTDIAVVRKSGSKLWWKIDLEKNGSTTHNVQFGSSSDIPVPGNYGGATTDDTADDIAVVRNTGSNWSWIVSTNLNGAVDLRKTYGLNSDTPMPGDYNGDGRTDFAVTRESAGTVTWKFDWDRSGGTDHEIELGRPGDTLLAADFDGDGSDDPTIVRDVKYDNGEGAPELETQVDELVLNHLEDNYIPGASIAVMKGGRLVLAKGYGYADFEKREPALVDTRMRLASASKVVSAMGFMKATEEFDVDLDSYLYGPDGVLDDDFYRPYIREAIDNKISGEPESSYERQRIKHVLSHSLHFGSTPSDFADTFIDRFDGPIDDFPYSHFHAHYLATVELKRRPGSISDYDNRNYEFLTLLMEEVTGIPYLDYMRDVVMTSIGLQDEFAAYVDGYTGDPRDTALHVRDAINYGRSTDTPVPADYDGDGRVDLAVIRIESGDRVWKIDTDRNGSTDITGTFGLDSDTPIAGDFDGDHKADIAIVRASGGNLAWRVDTDGDFRSNISRNYGLSTDQPIPGNYDDDTAHEFAVIRVDSAGNRWWKVDLDGDGDTEINEKFGTAEDLPLPGDYDGNGIMDFAVVESSSTGDLLWHFDYNRDGTIDNTILFGDADTDTPAVGDYNGDGTDDMILQTPSDPSASDSSIVWSIDIDNDGLDPIETTFSDRTKQNFLANVMGDGHEVVLSAGPSKNSLQWSSANLQRVEDVDPMIPRVAPSGGWIASAKSVSRLLRATDRFHQGAPIDLLSQDTIRELESRITPTFAAGWAVDRSARGPDGRYTLTHNGALTGSRSLVYKWPVAANVRGTRMSDDINVVVLINGETKAGIDDLAKNIGQEASNASISSQFDLFDPPPPH